MKIIADKIKCYKITPKSCCGFSFDNLIIRDNNSLQELLYHIRTCLEEQFEQSDNKWTDIGVNVECVEMSIEDFECLERD